MKFEDTAGVGLHEAGVFLATNSGKPLVALRGRGVERGGGWGNTAGVGLEAVGVEVSGNSLPALAGRGGELGGHRRSLTGSGRGQD